MSETMAHSWEEANQVCLMAALAEVRAALVKLLSPPPSSSPSRALPGDSSLTSSSQQSKGEGGVEPPQSQVPAAQNSNVGAEAAPGLESDPEAVRASMPFPPALETLCATFGLSSFERSILLMCAGVELDSRFAALCAAASKEQSLPTFSLALAAFADAHWSALLPGQPLRFWRFIEVLPGDALTTSPLRIDERILHFLAGMPSIDERLRGLTTTIVSPASGGDFSGQSGGGRPPVLGELPLSHRAMAEQLAECWAQANGQSLRPVVQLCGNDVAAKRAVAAEACALLGLHLRALPTAAAPRAIADLDVFTRLWERESALHPSALLLEYDDADATDAAGEAARKRLMETLRSPLLISTLEPLKPVERRLLTVQVLSATTREQLAVWKEALGASAAARDGRVETLVGQFSLNTGSIHAAVAQALAPASVGAGLALPKGTPPGARTESAADVNVGGVVGARHGVPVQATDQQATDQQATDQQATDQQATDQRDTDERETDEQPLVQHEVDQLAAALWDACRVQARPRLEGLAQRIEPAAAWDDLVLPSLQKNLLRQIAVHVRQRSKVYQTWGFAARGSRGLGISALFAGPSGTGKTMAGEVLASELRLDLYRIDLSQVVNKYIGETEKNLRRVFDAAEGGAAILLFDEADALFGKRSEVKDSHDRYANIEVGYLLQRMEAYRGLAILTTNRKEALDFAFLRRIRFVVEFPFPEPAQRAEIWRRVFPRQTPTEGLRVDRLARLSAAGGNIYNIAMGAAFLAADAGEPVRMSHLLAAARSEFTKIERPLTDAETAGWV